jgi:uncharacterized double-CXXCG motif protein
MTRASGTGSHNFLKFGQASHPMVPHRRRRELRFFEVLPDDANWGGSYDDYIDAVHRWSLPDVKCDQCGETWSELGQAFPAIDLSVLPKRGRYTALRPVPIEEFESLRELLLDLMPVGIIPTPGTKFGPLAGKGRGRVGDFAWINTWNLLARAEVYARLASSGLDVPVAAPTELRFSKVTPPLIELQIEPHGVLAPSAFAPDRPAPCRRCGREPGTIERIIIEGDSIPNNLDLFRLRNGPTKIVATERFVDVVCEMQLTNILFREAKVV